MLKIYTRNKETRHACLWRWLGGWSVFRLWSTTVDQRLLLSQIRKLIFTGTVSGYNGNPIQLWLNSFCSVRRMANPKRILRKFKQVIRAIQTKTWILSIYLPTKTVSGRRRGIWIVGNKLNWRTVKAPHTIRCDLHKTKQNANFNKTFVGLKKSTNAKSCLLR